jgi:AcrR family transcriptional regulator
MFSLALFAEKGYEKTTMRALAEHAGIGLGTIFKHYPDKPPILAAAFEDDLNAICSMHSKYYHHSG